MSEQFLSYLEKQIEQEELRAYEASLENPNLFYNADITNILYSEE